MIMSWIYLGMMTISFLWAVLTSSAGKLSAAVTEGPQSAIQLALSMAGALCLWSGAAKLMERCGITAFLSRLLRPLLHRVFPGTRQDPILAGALSANICANFLGLGNAATPMGIQAVKQMKDSANPVRATDEMCRLVVLNTSSIQLIPATVAAMRGSLGCATPFDILPAVWVTSLCSAGLGVCGAWLLGKVWKE